MSDSTSRLDKRKVVAFRIGEKVIPTFEDLAIQAKQAGLIREANLSALAKFSMNFFAEIWLQQQANIKRMEHQQYGNPGIH
jgi:hypothetical protein